MQLFYNLRDPATDDALHEIEAMRHFAGLKLARLPDETTILKFRHFLERHGLGKALFKEVNKHSEKNGLMLREGSTVDATLFRLRVLPRTKAASVTASADCQRCTRPKRAANGTSG
jgi:IS5 family transposase